MPHSNYLYTSGDTKYFQEHIIPLIKSAKYYAPFLSHHVHVYDMQDADFTWCLKNNVKITYSKTPLEYKGKEKDYWSNHRFVILADVLPLDANVLSLDADSIFVRSITETQFENDFNNCWITHRKNMKKGPLASAVGFKANKHSRHMLRQLLSGKHLQWFDDQRALDELFKHGVFDKMDLKYSDYDMILPKSIVWTGKGPRKELIKFKNKQDYWNSQIN